MSLMHWIQACCQRVHSSWKITTAGFPLGGNPTGFTFLWLLLVPVIVVRVYYADTRIFKPAGCSSKIMRCSPKRDDAVSMVERYSDRMWQTSPPYESDFSAYV